MLKFSSVVLSATLLASLAAVPAQASIQLAASDNGGASYVDVPGVAGLAGFTFVFPDSTGVTISSATGLGAPITTGLTLSSGEIALSGAAGSSVILKLTDTNYTSPTGLALLNDQLSTTDAAGVAKFSLTGYQDNSDKAFATGTGTPAGSLDATANAAQPLSLTGGGFVTGSSGPFTFATPYSLTEVLNVTFTTAGYVQAGFTAQLTAAAVPEPTSVLLFGTVLAGVGFAMRKRFRLNN